MMPGVIEGWSDRYGAPLNWDEAENGRCGTLHVRRQVDDGTIWMVSKWEPTPAELALLVAGGGVELWVSAPQHPVVSLRVAVPPPMTEPG